MKYKLARLNAGLTQKEAAILLGVTISFLSKAERGIRQPSRITLVKMKKVYNCNWEELF